MKGGRPRAKRCVPVVCVGRSRTPAVTRLPNVLCAGLCKALVSAAEGNNRERILEHVEVVQIHEGLLGVFGRRWCDVRAIPRGWLAATASASDKLFELVRYELGDIGFWAVRDTWTWRFGPPWQEMFVLRQVATCPLQTACQSSEVARSRHTRSQSPTETAHLYWPERVAVAATGTESVPRSLVTYVDPLSDWRGAFTKMRKALGIGWPVRIGDVQEAINAYLDRGGEHRFTPGRFKKVMLHA